jgi:cytochrome oxidase Cu insertion factor (SCO1/SenC/PrrC family)
MTRRRLLVLAVVALLAAGGTVGGLLATRGPSERTLAPPGLYRGSIPPAGIRAPDFTLHSYRGPSVRMGDLRGKVVLVTFLDTACRDKCPIITAVIGTTWPLLTPTERQRVDALAITVLPQIDTPARIKIFLRQRHALAALDWLTGPPSELPKVWKDYAILPAAQTGNANIHSASVRLFDRQGIWVSSLHDGVDLTPANLAHDIRVALRATD